MQNFDKMNRPNWYKDCHGFEICVGDTVRILPGGAGNYENTNQGAFAKVAAFHATSAGVRCELNYMHPVARPDAKYISNYKLEIMGGDHICAQQAYCFGLTRQRYAERMRRINSEFPQASHKIDGRQK